MVLEIKQTNNRTGPKRNAFLLILTIALLTNQIVTLVEKEKQKSTPKSKEKELLKLD